MNILLTIVIIIAILVAIILIAALFIKKDYAVEGEITINKPKQQVFNYIKLLKKQDTYVKWAMMDPQMKREYKGTDGTVGFVSAWDSDNKKVGKGEQEITKIKEGERLDSELRFIKPFEGKANAYMITTSVAENQTRVKWGFESRMKYPMNIMLVLMNLESMLKKDLDTGLNNLKTVLEKQ